MSKNKIYKSLAILSLGYLIVFNFVLINQPFYRQWDVNSTTYAINAYNHVKYGFMKTKGGNVDALKNLTSFPIQENEYYLSKIPLLSYIYVPLLKIFGKQEWCIRLVNILFAILFGYLFHHLLTIYIKNEKLVLSIFFIWCIIPANMYFRQITVPYNYVFLFFMFVLYDYKKWFANNNPKVTWRMLLFSGLSFSMYYDASFLVLTLIIYDFFKNRSLNRIYKLSGLILVQIAVFILYLLFIHFILDISILKLIYSKDSAAYRRSIFDIGHGFFTNIIPQFLKWLYVGINPVNIILLVFGIYYIKRDSEKISSLLFLLVMFGISQIIFLLVFPKEFFFHRVCIVNLTYLTAIINGYFLYRILQRKTFLKTAIFVISIIFSIIYWYQYHYKEPIRTERYNFAILLNKSTPAKTLIITNRYLSPIWDSYYLERNYFMQIKTLEELKKIIIEEINQTPEIIYVYDKKSKRNNNIQNELKNYLTNNYIKKTELKSRYILYYLHNT